MELRSSILWPRQCILTTEGIFGTKEKYGEGESLNLYVWSSNRVTLTGLDIA